MRGKRDANEPEIVAALRGVGADVAYAEREEYDLVVGYRRLTYLLEVKRDSKARLTKAQLRFRDRWRGHYAVVVTPDDALIAIGAV